MQDPNDPTSQTTSCCASLDERIRENPGRALFMAFGAGLAAALVVRALCEPQRPRSHVKHLLEEIREHLQELADPAVNRLNSLAGDGSAALKKGARHVNGLRRCLRDLGGKVENLFH